jgi:hypothetical protein
MRSLSFVVPAALRELLRNQPLSPGKITFAWRTAVGPALDRATQVTLDGQVLRIETTSAEWAREVRRSTGTILGRLQGLLGPDTVTSLEVTVRPSA